MAIRAGHRHLRFARFPGLAVALTLRGIGAMHSHRRALGTLDAPIPFTDDHLQLFGRHSTLRSLPGQRVAVENAVPWAMLVCMVCEADIQRPDSEKVPCMAWSMTLRC